MAYNLSLINGSGLTPLMSTVNEELMFGWYGNLALITMFIIFFMAFHAKTNNPAKATGFSALLIAIFSLMFRTINLIPDETVILCWIIAAVAIIIPILKGD